MNRFYSTHVANAAKKLSQMKLPKVPSPKEIKSHLDTYIIGQDISKKVLSVAVYNHYLRVNDKQNRIDKKAQRDQFESQMKLSSTDPTDPISSSNSIVAAGLRNLQNQFEADKSNQEVELNKSNVLLIGPTGSGKTLLATTLAKILKVPIAITDCTQLTQSGYIGDDVEKCIERLLVNADFNVAKAEKGIIVLDEIDKLAKSTSNAMSKDVSGEGVQQSLLKIIEGHKVELVANKPIDSTDQDADQNSSVSKKEKTYVVDTSNVLFMVMGAFVGLDEHILKRVNAMKNEVSHTDEASDAEKLNQNIKEKKTSMKPSEIELENGVKVPAFNLATPSDLISYGMIPELIGRVPITTSLEPLKTTDLYDIMITPKNALLKQYQYIFRQFGVKLFVTEKALIKIATLALNEGTGARGLRGILERLLLNVNYECPNSNVRYVLIDEETVKSLQQTQYSLSNSVEAKFFKQDEKETLRSLLMQEDPNLVKDMD